MQRNRTKQKKNQQKSPSLSHTVTKKNDKEIVTAYALATDGKAIAKGEDQIIVFVKDLLPGEKGKVEIIKKKSNYKTAHLTKLDSDSAANYRVTPPCNYYELCGGCQLQHISPEIQSDFKLQWLFETLRRIGKWNDENITEAKNKIEIVYLKRENYRRRIRLHFDGKHLGFKQNNSNKVINISNCLITSKLINEKLEFIRKNLLKMVAELNQKHWECEIEITESDDNKVVMHIADVSTENTTYSKEILNKLQRNLEIIPEQNIILNHPELPKFKIKKQSFVQPHLDCIHYYYKYIYNNIYDFINKNKEKIDQFKAYDLYAGAGVFSGIPHFVGKQLALNINCVGVEGIPEAIESLNHNYKNFPVTGLTEDVDHFIEKQFQQKLQAPHSNEGIHLLILDPPRAGCSLANMQKIVELCAKNALVLYLACDPASFARDTRVLLEGGFKLNSLTLFDSFGHTTHYEVLGCFEKK